MKTKFEIIGIVLLFALMTGCTNLELRSSETIRQEQAAQYQAQAAEYEDKGDLVEALKQYRLVLTVDPDNQIARDKSIQIEQELVRLADEHYQSGMAHYHEGRYNLAHQEFLAALSYDSDHEQLMKMFEEHRKLKQINRYVVHTMQPNESISVLAIRYYGDFRKFHSIAVYNQLEDATKIRVGRKLKIPVIEGFPIIADPSEIQTDAADVSQTESVEVIAVKRFIIHTVGAKDTLTTLAQRYYGDFRKYDLITKFNDMSVTDSIRVGQELKIPQVEGVPFLVTDSDEKIEESLDSETIPEAEKNLPETAVAPAKEADTTTEHSQASETIPQAEKYQPETAAAPAKEADITAEGSQASETIPQADKNLPETAAAPAKEVDITAEGSQASETIPQDDKNLPETAVAPAKEVDITTEGSQASETIPQDDKNLPETAVAPAKEVDEATEDGQALAYRKKGIQLYYKEKFRDAIIEFEKALIIKPDDQIAKDYMSLAYFELGYISFKKAQYTQAIQNFEKSHQYDSSCTRCETYINWSEENYKELHYRKGLSYFKEGKLAEAIDEWERIYKVDPNYKNVEKNLEKARNLMNRM
jgi:tetratricopeptide (TPR) repeat protein